MNKKRLCLFCISAMLFALLIYLSFAVTPADIIVRRSDAAVVQLAVINGTSPGYFGWPLLAEDINNDGRVDLITGASYKNLSGGAADYTGQVLVFYGGIAGFQSMTADNANVVFNGTYKSLFGSTILAEDMNNDSYKDLIISSYYKNLSGGNWDFTGQAYVFYGNANGLVGASSDNANVTFNGSGPGYFSVKMLADDLNNDSIKDLVIAAQSKNLSGGKINGYGQVHIFYGSTGGLHSYSADLANVTFNATTPADFGSSLYAADMNNDSLKDLIIGARGKNMSGGARDYTGQVHIYYASTDGFHSYTSEQANLTLNGTDKEDYFGENVCVGDINSDGLSDLVVNSRSARKDPWADNINMGQILVYYGSPAGFQNYNRRQANITINGTSTDGNHFGEFFTLADFNNDGYDDLLSTANQMNLSYGQHNQMGQAYIIYGNAGGFASTKAEDANISINGTGVKNYLYGYSTAAVNFNNYSHNGFAIAEIGASLSGGTADNTGRVYVYSLNFPPILSSVPNQSWNEDTFITINLSQYISDVNNDNPNITWTTPADVSVSVDEATNVVTLTANADWYGTEYITFYANDTFNGLVASNNITLSVSNTADCGDGTCDASETCTSCSADCGACATTPLGSSGTGIVQSGHTFSLIAADSPETAKFTGIAVNEIEFTTTEEISSAKIAVKEAELLSFVSAPLGEVNEYIEINAPKLEGKLKEAKIKFSVEKKWLEEKGFKADEVVLQRLNGNFWRKLTTNKVKEDASNAYYEAITPGFSLFAITAGKELKEVEEEIVEDQVEGKPVEEPEEALPETPESDEKQNHTWLYIALIAVLAVIAVVVLFKAKWHKRRHKFHKH
ncbi:MAG: PGF-pre-PGF domain-containing protein [Candidatus Nanoarchaeia archaeon]|nr:PGF-pre-PGF domain-containing protein [Candidatus Nanoarchaeia archaeon]